MTRRILLTVNINLKQMSSGQTRLVIDISSIKNELGEELDPNLRRVFLFHKPVEYTGEISVGSADYLDVVPVHVFNDIDKPEFGTISPTAWEDLPEAVIVEGPDLKVDDAVIPADVDLGPYTEDRIISSSAYVFTGNGASTATARDTVIAGLRALCLNFFNYANATTLMDIETYPEGWDEEDI